MRPNLTNCGDIGAAATAVAAGVSAAALTKGPMDDGDGDDAEIWEAVDSVTDEEVAEITDSTIIITDGAAMVQTWLPSGKLQRREFRECEQFYFKAFITCCHV